MSPRTQGGPGAVVRRRIELLEHVGRLGSISRAARAAGLSYKAAWQAVAAMNALPDGPLVARRTGGRGGGGAVLTEKGRRLVAAARRADQEHARFLRGLEGESQDLGAAWGWMRRLSMRTSARNQFFGKVARVRRGAVNAEVELALKGGHRVAAVITNESLADLDLRPGVEAFALIKASWVLLAAASKTLKVSARNRFLGRVEKVFTGAVNSEVVLRIPGGDAVTAVVTRESERELKIKPGAKLWAFFKASSVILGVQS